MVKLLDSADLGIMDADVPEANGGRNILTLVHRLGDRAVPLPLEDESHGTVAYLALLHPVINALKTGGTLFIDELDSGLHSLLAIQIMNLFQHSSTGAQLIFNTHDTNLLSSSTLRRDQVWFTEKKPDGSSVLYPLTDFSPRRHENLEGGYLQGRYGAVPYLKSRGTSQAGRLNDGEKYSTAPASPDSEAKASFPYRS